MPGTGASHTCNDGRGPLFGRKTPGCPRCDELLAVAETARHTCNDGHGPAFGRLTSGCARCDELAAGSRPVEFEAARRQRLAGQLARDLDDHLLSARHRSGACGLVCTAGQW